jgi:hypothetical protein
VADDRRVVAVTEDGQPFAVRYDLDLASKKAEGAQPISTFAASSAPNWKQGTFISLRRTNGGQVEAEGIYEWDKAGTVRPSRSLAIPNPPAVFAATMPALDFVLLGRARASAREQKSSTNGARRASAAQRDGPLPRAGDDEPPPADDVDPPRRLAVREAA